MMQREVTMNELLLKIINEYLAVFPNEKDRQEQFINYLNHYSEEQIVDWNNFDGHVVAGGFVYAKQDKKFLVLYQNDLEILKCHGGIIKR